MNYDSTSGEEDDKVSDRAGKDLIQEWRNILYKYRDGKLNGVGPPLDYHPLSIRFEHSFNGQSTFGLYIVGNHIIAVEKDPNGPNIVLTKFEMELSTIMGAKFDVAVGANINTIIGSRTYGIGSASDFPRGIFNKSASELFAGRGTYGDRKSDDGRTRQQFLTGPIVDQIIDGSKASTRFVDNAVVLNASGPIISFADGSILSGHKLHLIDHQCADRSHTVQMHVDVVVTLSSPAVVNEYVDMYLLFTITTDAGIVREIRKMVVLQLAQNDKIMINGMHTIDVMSVPSAAEQLMSQPISLPGSKSPAGTMINSITVELLGLLGVAGNQVVASAYINVLETCYSESTRIAFVLNENTVGAVNQAVIQLEVLGHKPNKESRIDRGSGGPIRPDDLYSDLFDCERIEFQPRPTS